MLTVSSPLIGYNTNVKHRGRVFHIQTEDSGAKYSRIVTHLFADGGRIINSLRLDYAEHLQRSDGVEFVKNLMRNQHKTMYLSLRRGELDEVIEQACGPHPEAFEAPRVSLNSGG
jgi:hypothetical protein